jgi:heptosyltransferase III
MKPSLRIRKLRKQIDPQPLALAPWSWQKIHRVLVVRLRSIGDTVLATPSLYALRRFLPHAQIDILLEDWIAPLLNGSDDIDNVITIKRKNMTSRMQIIKRLRTANYDVAFNLHGGSTATFLTRMSGSKHRVGYLGYRYGWLHNHLAPAPNVLWGREDIHSVEQQLGLLGWTGVPVTDLPPTKLTVTEDAVENIKRRFHAIRFSLEQPFVLIHPSAAFKSKQWDTVKFARVAEYLHEHELTTVAIVASHESSIVHRLSQEARIPVISFTDLTLPEITALAARAQMFVGNDSGIAHIAAAVGTPCVVIFGSSNIVRWRPWTSVPAKVVSESLPCVPCPGKVCTEFESPQCIERITVERVIREIENIRLNS